VKPSGSGRSSAAPQVENRDRRHPIQICADFYPDEALSPRSAAVLDELFS